MRQRRPGIRSPNDLYGGVVPDLFAEDESHHPWARRSPRGAATGWCSAFAERVREIVLPGYTVFSNRDARVGGRSDADARTSPSEETGKCIRKRSNCGYKLE